MLTIRGRLCVAAATVILTQTGSVKAQDLARIAGVGTENCDSWTKYVRYPYEPKPGANAMEIGLTSWAMGYASAAAVRGGPGVFRNNDNNSFIDAISRRCKDFPSARIDAVIEKILKEAP